MDSITEQRAYKVIKDNVLIQKTRYSLTLQQQKLLAYLISQIRPNDSVQTIYTIDINDVCDVMGLDRGNTFYYTTLREDLKKIATTAVWITTPQRDTLVWWLGGVWIERGRGTIKYCFSLSVSPYLFGLESHFTEYVLGNVLAFHSRYGVRLYELARSYGRLGHFGMELDKFKKLMDATIYDRFADLRRKVIEPAVEDINTFSDMKIEPEYIKHGKSINGIAFYIKGETLLQHIITNDQRRKVLNRQTERRNGK